MFLITCRLVESVTVIHRALLNQASRFLLICSRLQSPEIFFFFEHTGIFFFLSLGYLSTSLETCFNPAHMSHLWNNVPSLSLLREVAFFLCYYCSWSLSNVLCITLRCALELCPPRVRVIYFLKTEVRFAHFGPLVPSRASGT